MGDLSSPPVARCERTASITSTSLPSAGANPNFNPAGATQRRYHDFDALRAGAMLLGIVLHGLMSFVELPPDVWPAQDIEQNTPVYGFVVHGLHGFRLPLFFMMSGFFTTMLLRKRGLKELLAHRAKRILLPLLFGWFAVWPALIGVGMFAGNSQISIWGAASRGDIDQVQSYLASGGDIEARFELPGVAGSGATPLHLAVAGGHEEVIEVLIEQGADINAIAKDRDRAAPLHWAAFVRSFPAVKILVKAGADINAIDVHGNTPLNLVSDPEDAREENVAIAEFLKSRGATRHDVVETQTPTIPLETIGLAVLLLSFAPFFAHLWFLWYLCWLIAGFAIVVAVAKRFQWKPLNSRFVSSPYCWFWLLPLTLAAQLCMVQTFGPDTSAGIIPWPPVLAYYAIFFGFGAVLYGNSKAEQSAGRHWMLWLLLAAVTLPSGVWLFETRPGGDMLTAIDFGAPTLNVPRGDLDVPRHVLTSTCAVVYCWSMIFASIGIFRRYFSGENRRVRYISDSAYWLYLAHLPLIQLFQVAVQDWSYPSIVKVSLVCVATVAILLLSYEYCVRYTFIGTTLHGKRYRRRATEPQSA